MPPTTAASEHYSKSAAIWPARRRPTVARTRAAAAAFNVAILLEARGELRSAEAAYRRADARPVGATCNLGVLREQQGDLTGAIDAYRRAYDHGDANGAFNLAALLEEHGDSVGAIAAYRYTRGLPERRRRRWQFDLV